MVDSKVEVRCDATIEVWGPHPGCREFMSEPETFVCGEQAVRLWVVEEHDPDGRELVTYARCNDHGLDGPLPYAEVQWTTPIDEVDWRTGR